MVYDSAFNSFASLEKAVKLAKEAGMTDIQVVAVHNDAITAFSNTVIGVSAQVAFCHLTISRRKR